MVLQMLGYHVTSLAKKCNTICHVALMEFSRLVRMPIQLGPVMWFYPTVQIGTRQQKHQFVIDPNLESIQSINLLVGKITVSDSVRRAIMRHWKDIREIILKRQRKSRKRSYQYIICSKLYVAQYIIVYLFYLPSTFGFNDILQTVHLKSVWTVHFHPSPFNLDSIHKFDERCKVQLRLGF